jgi:hypothetical protein
MKSSNASTYIVEVDDTTSGVTNDDVTMEPGPRGNQQPWRHLDEVGHSASRAPDNKPEQQDERNYFE